MLTAQHSDQCVRGHGVAAAPGAAPAMLRAKTSAEDVVLVASVEEMAKTSPCHDARKRILATDALALVDGFRTMVQLTFQHLWGMFFVRIA